jgi:hypothetical protein
MQARIDMAETELKADLRPRNCLERTVVTEIARATIQVSVCQAQLSVDDDRVREKGDSEWDADRRREADNLAVRIGKDPCRVAHALEATLHGAEWCLDHWRDLGASVAQNGHITESQRQFACDLMGISLLFRDHFAKVPACDDKEGLLALVARQIERLETRIRLVLKERDEFARTKALLGLPTAPDATTKRVKSNEARATKRLIWSIDTFNTLRRGVAPATIIDPETRKPLKGTEAAAAPPPPPPRTAAQPPPAAPTCASDKTAAQPACETPRPRPAWLKIDNEALMALLERQRLNGVQAGRSPAGDTAGGSQRPRS